MVFCAVAVACSGASPGGGGEGGTCSAVAVCDSSVVGGWEITQSCLTASPDLSSICAGVTASVVFSFSGTGTYNADLTYAQTGSMGAAIHYFFPASCVGAQTCAQVQSNIMSASSSSTMAMGFTFQSVTCASNAGGCACDAKSTPASQDETGTYTVAGGILTTTHGGTRDTAGYCVSGATMHQMPTTGDTQVKGAVVFRKQ